MPENVRHPPGASGSLAETGTCRCARRRNITKRRAAELRQGVEVGQGREAGTLGRFDGLPQAQRETATAGEGEGTARAIPGEQRPRRREHVGIRHEGTALPPPLNRPV